MNRFHLSESVDQSAVRLYVKDQHTHSAYNNRESYDVLLVLNYETSECVYVSKLISKVKLTSDDVKEFKRYLKDKGIKTIRYERKSKIITEDI